MTSRAIDKKTLKKAGDYVGARLSGANKMESAIAAGYSMTTARKPSLIESTKAYQAVIDQVLSTSANIMLLLVNSLEEDLKNGKLDTLKTAEKALIHKTMVDANDKLVPKVTLKQSTDKNGNVTRTAWAQNASQVQEVLSDEQGIEGE